MEEEDTIDHENLPISREEKWVNRSISLLCMDDYV